MRLRVATALLWLVLAAPSWGLAKESFRLVPGAAKYTTTTEFESGKLYRFTVSGTMTAEQTYTQTVIGAYNCIAGPRCTDPSSNRWAGQNFAAYDERGALLSVPNDSFPSPSDTGDYTFDMQGLGGDDRISFLPLQDEPTGGAEVIRYTGPGFLFKIEELPGTLAAGFIFAVDGLPDRPKPSLLPDALVGVEVETDGPARVRGPDADHLAGEGEVSMTTRYRRARSRVRERKVHFVLDSDDVAQHGYGPRLRTVSVAARVDRSQDRNCPAGARVRFTLSGLVKKRTLFSMVPDGGPDCLAERSLFWDRRGAFKKAIIRRLKPRLPRDLRR